MSKQEFASCPLPPGIGNEIYLDDFPAGPDSQINGGKAVVTGIEDFTSGSIALKFITTDVSPTISFNWEDLGVDQKNLEKEFGETRATIVPNCEWSIK
jgi:hypothetical protein